MASPSTVRAEIARPSVQAVSSLVGHLDGSLHLTRHRGSMGEVSDLGPAIGITGAPMILAHGQNSAVAPSLFPIMLPFAAPGG